MTDAPRRVTSAPPPLDGAAPLRRSGAAPPRARRRWVKAGVFVVLALVWIRFVLFEFVFPEIERHVDNPELDADAASDPDAPALLQLDPQRP